MRQAFSCFGRRRLLCGVVIMTMAVCPTIVMAEGPSFEETVTWIRSKIPEQHPGSRYGFTAGLSSDLTESCWVVWRNMYEDNPSVEWGIVRYSVPLDSLDPEKTKWRCDENKDQCEIEVGTTDNKKDISRKKQEDVEWVHHNSARILIHRDEELAKRLYQAVLHLIELCGGKVSKPEPF